MSDVVDIIRDATVNELVLGLAARGARTTTLKSGKVRISVTVKMEREAPKPRKAVQRNVFVRQFDPDIRV